jgi:hypothetical protein
MTFGNSLMTPSYFGCKLPLRAMVTPARSPRDIISSRTIDHLVMAINLVMAIIGQSRVSACCSPSKWLSYRMLRLG